MNKTQALAAARDAGRMSALGVRSGVITGTLSDTELNKQTRFIAAYDPTADYSDKPVGHPVTYDGHVWTLLQPHNAANYPGAYPGGVAMWKVRHTKDPADAKPFVKQDGTLYVYGKGDVCLWTDGVVYKALRDGENYSPSEYPAGWEKVS